jgi:hypothetical protein
MLPLTFSGLFIRIFPNVTAELRSSSVSGGRVLTARNFGALWALTVQALPGSVYPAAKGDR